MKKEMEIKDNKINELEEKIKFIEKNSRFKIFKKLDTDEDYQYQLCKEEDENQENINKQEQVSPTIQIFHNTKVKIF
jgi:hypothetical protein